MSPLTRFEAEEVLREAASGVFPKEGDTLVRTNDGWIFQTLVDAITDISFLEIDGTIIDNQVTLSSVKQFESFLAIAFTQLTGQILNSQVPASAINQWCDEILKCEPFNMILARSTGDIADDRIPASAILQHVQEILRTPIFSMILSRSVGDIANERVPASAVVQWCEEILNCETFRFIKQRATSRRPWSVNDRLSANGALA